MLHLEFSLNVLSIGAAAKIKYNMINKKQEKIINAFFLRGFIISYDIIGKKDLQEIDNYHGGLYGF